MKLLVKHSFSQLFVFKLFLFACTAVGVAFVLLRYSILLRIQDAVHIISNLWLEVRDYSASCRIAGLRFVIILLPAALLKWFDCKSCAIYGASRLISNSATSSTLMHSSGMARGGGYRRHSARSLPSGFLTQTPYTRLTLFSYHFFFLSFDFIRFSFFRRLLLVCSLFMPLYMVCKLVLFSSSVSTSC